MNIKRELARRHVIYGRCAKEAKTDLDKRFWEGKSAAMLDLVYLMTKAEKERKHTA